MNQIFVLKRKNLVLLFGICFAILLLVNMYDIYNINVYGHLFTRDQTGTFVSIVDQLQTELELIVTNLANNNVSLAENHASKAGSLIHRVISEIAEDNPRLASDLMRAVNDQQNISSTSKNEVQATDKLVNDLNERLDNAKIIRIAQVQPSSNLLDEFTNFLGGIFGGNRGEQSSEQAQNTKIEALAFAELMDSVLINYGKAYNVGFDMTNMSNMVMTGSNASTSSTTMSNPVTSNNSVLGSMNMKMELMGNSSSPMTDHRGEWNSGYQLVDIADYQTAQALAKKGLEFFNTDLRQMAINNKTVFVTNLESGLTHLNNSIGSKASPLDVMMIVHSEIHPNLLEAFNLPLRK